MSHYWRPEWEHDTSKDDRDHDYATNVRGPLTTFIEPDVELVRRERHLHLADLDELCLGLLRLGGPGWASRRECDGFSSVYTEKKCEAHGLVKDFGGFCLIGDFWRGFELCVSRGQKSLDG